MKKYFGILSLFILSGSLFAQDDINKFDAEGKRHGKWSKTYEGTNVLRYEGTFFHGKEVDTFKYYKNVNKKASLAAIKVFNKDNNIVDVKFFSSKGKLISEGKMNDKLYIGTWKFYQKDSKNLLTLENYNASGELDGERFVYYSNGNLTEKQNYKNGKLHGESTFYADNKTLLKSYIYVEGELHGNSKIYNAKGQLIVEGDYKNDKKDGIWKYYEKGKLKEEKDFTYKPKFIKDKDGKYIKNPETK